MIFIRWSILRIVLKWRKTLEGGAVVDNETKQMFELVLNKLESIDVGLGRVETRLDKVETRLNSVESRQDETFELVKAVEHSNNIKNAETDNLTYKIAHVEGTVSGIGEFIQQREA